MMKLETLRFQNPHWDRVENFFRDPSLERLKKAPKILVHPIKNRIILESDRIFIMKGPRQIGKTTLVKLLMKEMLQQGKSPGSLLYLAVDIAGLKSEHELFTALVTYKEFADTRGPGTRFIFLDEVTAVADWQTAIKKAYDSGILSNSFVLATGSSALDLKRGSERLPGRRGQHPQENDLEMLPFLFRHNLENLFPQVKLPEAWDPAHMSFENLYQKAQQLSYFDSVIKKAFDGYLLTGGLPLSTNEYLRQEGDTISPEPYYTYLQAILGDVMKIGKSERYFREIITAVISKQFEPLDAYLITQMTGVGSHNTIAEYLDTLDGFYLLRSLNQPKTLGAVLPAFKKRKKIYFRDPFFYHVLHAWINAIPDPFHLSYQKLPDPIFKSKLVENTVGAHLMTVDGTLFFWRNNYEIDFILVPPQHKSLYFEVKYQTVLTGDDYKGLKKAGGGILLTRDSLAQRQDNLMDIPVHLFLALIKQ
jgi:predicted AAA+ superfamily ATPase